MGILSYISYIARFNSGSIYVIGAGSAYLFGSLFGSDQSNKSVSNTPSTDARRMQGKASKKLLMI
jgi:hypothetical protein